MPYFVKMNFGTVNQEWIGSYEEVTVDLRKTAPSYPGFLAGQNRSSIQNYPQAVTLPASNYEVVR